MVEIWLDLSRHRQASKVQSYMRAARDTLACYLSLDRSTPCVHRSSLTPSPTPASFGSRVFRRGPIPHPVLPCSRSVARFRFSPEEHHHPAEVIEGFTRLKTGYLVFAGTIARANVDQIFFYLDKILRSSQNRRTIRFRHIRRKD